jgi:hypothetical protein
VWPAEVAEATPTAPASMTSPDEDVVRPSCCREEPGISSAGKTAKAILSFTFVFACLFVCVFICLIIYFLGVGGGGLYYFVFNCISINKFP